MNNPTKTILSAGSFLAATLAVNANQLTLNTFQLTGGGNATITGATNTGASIAYTADETRGDRGLAASINSGTPATFSSVGDTLTYSFNISGIETTTNAFTPIFFTGFDFGDNAVLRYGTSIGSGGELDFTSNTNGNPFSGGTVDFEVTNWAPFELENIRFRTGSDIDATVSLELVNITNLTSYDYKMTVSYISTINATDFNTAVFTFTGVNGNEVRSVFHVSNSSNMGDGTTFTIGDASLSSIPEPNSFALMGGLTALGLVLSRRR